MNNPLEQLIELIQQNPNEGDKWIIAQAKSLQQETNDGWVSVEELPELDTEVIICSKYMVGTAVYEYSGKEGCDCFVNDNYTYFKQEDITHWMLLPNPPKN